MRVASTQQMKLMDKTAIEERKIPSLDLMEKAAEHVTKEVLNLLCQKDDPMVVLFCGTGNNGGDGYACARQLKAAGVSVRVILVGSEEKLTADAAFMVEAMNRAAIFAEHYDSTMPALKCDCIVDALFGVGLNREVSGAFAAAIRQINAADCTVVSCDIPSGINGDSGEVMGVAVKADKTVTFSCAKPGLLVGEGEKMAGDLTVADIGIPADLLQLLSVTWIKPGRYRHFKGNEYRVLNVAKHSETLQDMVVYQALYGGGGTWVRPAEMWNEQVSRDGYHGPRFSYIGE